MTTKNDGKIICEQCLNGKFQTASQIFGQCDECRFYSLCRIIPESLISFLENTGSNKEYDPDKPKPLG